MEDEHDVVGHALLSNNHFFASVDDKVTTLVESALFSISDDFLVLQNSQMAEFGPHHDGHFAKEDPFAGIRMQNSESRLSLFYLFQSSALWWFLLQFKQPHIDVNFCAVGEVSDPRFMREYCLVAFVNFLYSRTIVDMHLFEDDFIVDVFIPLIEA